MCWYPIALNERITKDGVVIPPSLVPCGKCLECLQKKRADWSFRLQYELQKATSATFLTLTYANEYIKTKNGFATLQKKDFQNYFKRVRHENPNLKYYGVGEYGTKNRRPHYHAIVFNADNDTLREKWSVNGESFGIVSCDTVTPASIHYVTGYIIGKYGNIDEHGLPVLSEEDKAKDKPFAIMSKGLGKNYAEKAAKYHIENETFTAKHNGQKFYLSRYLKMKIFINEEERRLQITESEKQKIVEKLKSKSSREVFTSRAYLRELNKYSQNKKKLK